ncbi:MAG: hypothetical protein ACRDWI_01585 [Jiangellaceae bacterium]
MDGGIDGLTRPHDVEQMHHSAVQPATPSGQVEPAAQGRRMVAPQQLPELAQGH